MNIEGEKKGVSTGSPAGYFETALYSVAVFIDGGDDMFSGEGEDLCLVDEPGGGDVFIVEMPENLFRGVAVRNFHDDLCKLACLIAGDEYLNSGCRVYELH